MNLSALSRMLADTPALASRLEFSDIVKYVSLVQCLQPVISLLLPSFNLDAPETLPHAHHEFLRVCMGLPDDIAKLVWTTFRNLAWNDNPDDDNNFDPGKYIEYTPLFLEHGLSCGISLLSFYSGDRC
jgi:hypothetical protein